MRECGCSPGSRRRMGGVPKPVIAGHRPGCKLPRFHRVGSARERGRFSASLGVLRESMASTPGSVRELPRLRLRPSRSNTARSMSLDYPVGRRPAMERRGPRRVRHGRSGQVRKDAKQMHASGVSAFADSIDGADHGSRTFCDQYVDWRAPPSKGSEPTSHMAAASRP
jgi:hypothetical protein